MAWPAPGRDAGAAVLALAALLLGKLLTEVLPLPPGLLLALPGLVLAWLVFGPLSAGFAALLVAFAMAKAVGWSPPGAAGWRMRDALVLLGAATLPVLCGLVAHAWARRRERRASLLLDACATDAVGRIASAAAAVARAEAEAAAARQRLAEAEAALREARRAADAGIEEARRREGGI